MPASFSRFSLGFQSRQLWGPPALLAVPLTLGHTCVLPCLPPHQLGAPQTSSLTHQPHIEHSAWNTIGA